MWSLLRLFSFSQESLRKCNTWCTYGVGSWTASGCPVNWQANGVCSWNASGWQTNRNINDVCFLTLDDRPKTDVNLTSVRGLRLDDQLTRKWCVFVDCVWMTSQYLPYIWRLFLGFAWMTSQQKYKRCVLLDFGWPTRNWRTYDVCSWTASGLSAKNWRT